MGTDRPLHRAPIHRFKKSAGRRGAPPALGRRPASRIGARSGERALSRFHFLSNKNRGPLTVSAVKSQIVAAWNRFFFEPIPAYSLGLFRIAYAAMLLVVLALLLPDVPVWYGEEGVLPAASASGMLDAPRFSLLTWFPQSELAVYAVFGCAFVAAGALLIGFWTRWASIAVWACVVTLHHRNVYLLNSGDHLLRSLSFLLMFAPAGAAFSLDRRWRIRRGIESRGVPMIVPWAQRMLQLQLCI